VRRDSTVRWLCRYGPGSSGWIASTFECGFTGGKNAIVCGDGGRVTDGRFASDDSAADELAVLIVDSVRVRSCVHTVSRPLADCGGSVLAAERADEIDMRRPGPYAEYGGSLPAGDPDAVLILVVGDDERCCRPFKDSTMLEDGEVDMAGSAALAGSTVSGARGAGRGTGLETPCVRPRKSGCGRKPWSLRIECDEGGRERCLGRGLWRGASEVSGVALAV
jgi:hypothetical protein